MTSSSSCPSGYKSGTIDMDVPIGNLTQTVIFQICIPRSDEEDLATALGLGLGIGIPVLIIVALLIYCCRRLGRQRHAPAPAPADMV